MHLRGASRFLRICKSPIRAGAATRAGRSFPLSPASRWADSGRSVSLTGSLVTPLIISPSPGLSLGPSPAVSPGISAAIHAPLATFIPTPLKTGLKTPLGNPSGSRSRVALIGAGIRNISSKISGNIPLERAHSLSSKIFDDSFPASKLSLDPPSGKPGRSDGKIRTGLSPVKSSPKSRPEGPRAPAKSRLRLTLEDRTHHARLYLANLRWYTVTHILNMWPSYRAKVEAAKTSGIDLPVSKHRRFFSWMRGMGQNGAFYVMGFSPLTEDAVVTEALWTYDRYFTAPSLAPRTRKAFADFMERARGVNADKRAASHFRKTVRDAMLKAAFLPSQDITAHFEGLARDKSTVKAEKFQARHQENVLNAFREAVLATLAEENPLAKNRIVALLVLGSFARGGAHSRSDFDTHPVTANGGGGRVADFHKRLLERWTAMGGHHFNPVSIIEFPTPPSKGVLAMAHNDPYLVVSLNAALIDELSRRPEDKPVFTVAYEMNWRRRAARRLHILTVFTATLLADFGFGR